MKEKLMLTEITQPQKKVALNNFNKVIQSGGSWSYQHLNDMTIQVIRLLLSDGAENDR